MSLRSSTPSTSAPPRHASRVRAAIAPRSFYDSFPGGGRHWLLMLGPYDEHLVRDNGVLRLALMVMSAWAAVRRRAEIWALVGAGWITFALPHLIFHLNHWSGMSLADQNGNVNLAGTVVLAAALAIPFTTNPGNLGLGRVVES